MQPRRDPLSGRKLLDEALNIPRLHSGGGCEHCPSRLAAVRSHMYHDNGTQAILKPSSAAAATPRLAGGMGATERELKSEQTSTSLRRVSHTLHTLSRRSVHIYFKMEIVSLSLYTLSSSLHDHSFGGQVCGHTFT